MHRKEREVFLFVFLVRNFRYAFDIKQEIFDKPLLHHFHDHILGHLLDLHYQGPSATHSAEYSVVCKYLGIVEYQDAATAVKLPIMLAACHYSCSFVKNIVFSAAILFSKLVHVHLISL